ncbi:MAG TPA: sialidase family protein [Ktedonobacterales bacterium]|nr:sialidase family protein [Ktedonobacterales bacterium]
MSDHPGHGDQHADDEAQRAQRRDAIRSLAWDAAGDPPHILSSTVTSPPSQTPARRNARRVALVVLLVLIVVVVATGTFAFIRNFPSFDLTAQRTAGPSATGVPLCARQSLASATIGATGQTSATAANIRVSDDAYRAHSEPMLAINPANPLNLLGGSKFFTDPAHYRFQIGTYVSFDGGCSWQDNGVLPGFAPSELTSDVSMAFGPNNRAYVAVLYTNNARDSGIAVLTSTDGGKTFGQPVRVYDDASGAVFSDKPWLTVDMTNSPTRGSIYVVWSYDYGGSCGYDNACKQGLGFVRSTDGGTSFSAMRQIEGQAPFCTNPAKGRAPDSRLCDAILGAIPAVLPDGTLAVGFDYFDLMSTGTIPTRLALITSHDGGVSWSPPVSIATASDILGTFPPDHYRNFSLPAFAAGPTQGTLYIAWSDKTFGDADILFTSSRDGGVTWSKPLRVNDDARHNGANQFQPQLAVAPNGVVTVSFFDTRNDSHHHLIDVYLAQSTDGGATFRQNVRVTSQSWDPSVDAPVDGGGLQFIGDYQGLAVDNTFAYPFWNDTRTGSQEIFTAPVPSAQP